MCLIVCLLMDKFLHLKAMLEWRLLDIVCVF